jgi:hypothetical protein
MKQKFFSLGILFLFSIILAQRILSNTLYLASALMNIDALYFYIISITSKTLYLGCCIIVLFTLTKRNSKRLFFINGIFFIILLTVNIVLSALTSYCFPNYYVEMSKVGHAFLYSMDKFIDGFILLLIGFIACIIYMKNKIPE